MIPRFLVLMICAAVPCTTAFASAEFDYLMGDLQKFEEDIQMNAEAELNAKEEHEYQSSDEFFPGTEDRERGALTETVLSEFVNIQVDGQSVDLTDVAGDVWFAPYVRDVASRGIVSGYRAADGSPLGLFGPTNDVTVEQLAKMAIEANGHDLRYCAKGNLRNKSAEGDWSELYIQCAEELHWAVYADGSVDVKRPATRSEVVITTLQAFGVHFGRAEGTAFTDVTSSTEFSGAIERAAEDNIVSGYANAVGVPTGVFGPSDPVNRAAMAKILSLALQAYAR
tara:strand:+ start:76 stop:921 length:846 start_codon:yes stop_codon:yes gene_type:complete